MIMGFNINMGSSVRQQATREQVKVRTYKVIYELLDDVRKKFNLAVLFITHDLRVAAQVCHRIAVMHGFHEGIFNHLTLTVPGLDRSFSTTEPSGEALLAPYRARIPIPVEDAGRA